MIMRLSRRERWLLIAAMLLALPLGLAMGVAQPLAERRLAAEERLAQAQAQGDWLRARQRELAALPVAAAAPAEQPAAVSPVGLGGIEARLTDDGLREHVVALAAPARGEVLIQFEEVGFGPVMHWIEAIEAQAGYALGALRLRRGNEPGAVNAEVRLEPRS